MVCVAAHHIDTISVVIRLANERIREIFSFFFSVLPMAPPIAQLLGVYFVKSAPRNGAKVSENGTFGSDVVLSQVTLLHATRGVASRNLLDKQRPREARGQWLRCSCVG